MSRISEADITRITAEADLVALVQSRGVALRPLGRDWTGRCPFHDDPEPQTSLVVTPAAGLWRCTDSRCGRSGNAVRFLEAFDGLSFRHAFELLAHGGTAAFGSHPDGPRKQSTVPRLPCPLDPTAPDPNLLEQVAAYYATRLAAPENRAAREFLSSRGLGDEALWQRFGIGCSDRTLGLRIPAKNRLRGAGLRDRLQFLGVYRSNGREHFNGCVTIPVRDSGGRLTQLYGRRTDPKAARATRHLHLPEPLTGIFNPAALANREIIVAGSIIDALTFISHGSEAGLALMEATICACGPPGLSDELFDAIRSARIESVRLAYPADEVGDAAVAQAAARLHAIGIECHRIRFPSGMDANQSAVEKGCEALGQAVRSADWIDAKACLTTSPFRGDATIIPPPEVPESADTTVRDPRVSSAESQAVPVDEPPALSGQPAPAPGITKTGDCHQAAFGSRLYRIGGLEKNSSPEVLKITLRLSCEGLMHVDTLDLYRDGERRKFIDRAAEETGLTRDLLKRDLGKLLLALEQTQDARFNPPREHPVMPGLSPADQAEALELLRAPDLLTRIASAYDQAGIAGEQSNLLAAYLACASRKLDKPLAVIIQSTSAAGKSTLMEAVLSFFPAEEQMKYSAMTGQSLYYLGERSLQHKILAIVEEEGAEKAGYALKLLQSEGELTIASTGKDPRSGRMETQVYHVEGPAAILLSTTSINLDEELMNRCLVLTVDESREQTERIHHLQREARTIEGILAAERRQDILRVMQNAQRLIRPMRVANPFARHLTFTSGRTRTRRDHEKYLTLIDTIALLHQHQRQPILHQLGSATGRPGRQVAVLPVTLEDIEAANRIAPEVLGRSLDELPPQTRRLLESVQALVRERTGDAPAEQEPARFNRSELRGKTGWSETQTRLHLARLETMEYVRRRSGRQGSLCQYELLADATEPRASWHVGLIDVAKLRREYSAP